MVKQTRIAFWGVDNKVFLKTKPNFYKGQFETFKMLRIKIKTIPIVKA